jgi:regulatory protein
MPMGTSHNQKAMNAAVRILANRDHSKYELKLKLQHRGFRRQDIDAVILKCERFGYIDDRRTARVYIIQLKRKCFGRRYIRQALKKKRLMGAAIEKILSEDYPAEDEHQYARKLLDKKMKPFEHETDAHKRKDKMYRFLNSRGFSPAVIVELVK